MPALLADALDEPVFVTIDGERRQITKREAIVRQLVNKSTTADLRATKMLFDMMKEAEQKADAVAPAEKMCSLRLTRRWCGTWSSGYAGRCWPRWPRSSVRPAARAGTALMRPPARTETRPMTDDQLVEELHELKRCNQTPIALIEMFDALLSLDPRLSAKQRRKKSYEIMAAALPRLERKDA